MSGIGRFLIGLLGIILLYLAFFITVDEYGAIQNRLEALWKRIRSIQSTVIGWQTAFLSEISKWFVDGINSLFGASVFSLQSIACSVVICAVPMVLGFVFLGSASLAIRVLFGVYFLYLAVQATFRESIESDPPITWVLCKIILLCASPDVYKWWAYYGTEAIRHNVVSCSKELLLGLLLPFFLIFAIG